MFRWVNAAATLAMLSLLVACSSSQQASQAGPSLVPAAAGTGFHHGMSPDKDCGGTGGVTVTPCPVHLTKHTRSGVVVTVGGPGLGTPVPNVTGLPLAVAFGTDQIRNAAYVATDDGNISHSFDITSNSGNFVLTNFKTVAKGVAATGVALSTRQPSSA